MTDDLGGGSGSTDGTDEATASVRQRGTAVPAPSSPEPVAEHEEARRRAGHFVAKYLAIPGPTESDALGLALADALALLAKAEQERDARRDRKVLCEQQERELERLREALLTWENYDLALRDGRQEDAAHFYDAMVEKFDALSADTQREP